jgi:hypothetical protein
LLAASISAFDPVADLVGPTQDAPKAGTRRQM